MMATNDQEACTAGFFVLYSIKMFANAFSSISEITSMTSIIIFVAITASIGWLAASYAKLSNLRSEIDQAFDRIDVHIKERHQLAPAFVEAVKQRATQTPASAVIINNVMQARHTMATAAERVRAFSNDTSSINSLVNADVAFSLALERLAALQITHASLANDERFTKLSKDLITIENNISFTHQLYNEVVNSYNNACIAFPAVLLAGALGFRAAGTLAPSKKRNTSSGALSQA
jgi:hypothetical protein